MDITSGIMAGGLLGGLVLAWSHVKEYLKYIVSAVVINAEFDSDLASSVAMYLKSEYKLVPSGNYVMWGVWRKFKSDKMSHMVPHRIWNQNRVILYRGFSVLFLSSKNGNLSVSSLRGMINFERLTSLSVDQRFATVHARSTKREDRFVVMRKLGSLGSFGNDHNPPRKRDNSGSDSLAEVTAGGDVYTGLNRLIDLSSWRSFKHDPSEFLERDDFDPFTTLKFPDHVMKEIDECHVWFNRQEWYADRGIPYKRGMMVYGPGGTGKSSVARALAQSLGIPLYQFYLSTYGDEEFLEHWYNMVLPAVALFEDFDAVFNGRENMNKTPGALSFDTVLNAISGVEGLEGVLLIVTTNHLEKVDPAMGVSSEAGGNISTRPGRIDSVIYLGYADKDCRLSICQRILKDWPECIDELLSKHSHVEELTPAQWQEICIQQALLEMRKEKLEI